MAIDSMASPTAITPHMSETERVIATLWVEVLDAENFPQVSDSFFDLGGDSIAMVTVLFRIQEELSVELPSGAMLGAPSLQALAALVDTARADLPSTDRATEPASSAPVVTF